MTPDEIAVQNMIAEGAPDTPLPYWPEDTDPGGGTVLEVTAVNGRYPEPRATFKSDNIEAHVIASGPGKFVIRLDDRQNETMWLEIRVTVPRVES